jgi:hypothetical protein
MTLSFGKTKLKVQKKFIAFFTIVPLLAATAFLKVPCPVCAGAAVVSSTGMSGVVVTSLESVELDTFLVGCDAYRVYQYGITLTLQNEGDQDAGGYISLILINTQTGQLLDTQYTVVEVAVGMSVETQFSVAFMVSTMLEQPDITEIKTKVLNSDVDCSACKGKGEVPMNSWPLLDSMKQSFVQSQRVATPFLPPLHVETEANPGDY